MPYISFFNVSPLGPKIIPLDVDKYLELPIYLLEASVFLLFNLKYLKKYIFNHKIIKNYYFSFGLSL